MNRKISYVKLAFLALICLSPVSLHSQETEEISWRWGLQSAYYLPNQDGYENQNGWAPISYSTEELPTSFSSIGLDEGRDLGNGWGAAELQGWIDGTKVYPFLQGSGPLTRDNNLTVTGKMDLSPATADLNLSFKLTPVAFLVLEQGNHLGTGWYCGLANGLGLNSDGSGDPDTTSFPGLVYRGWWSGTFQFDLAAVLPEPNDWKHVVLSSTAKFQYQHFTAADDDQPWQYQADSGENFNGWNFLTTSVLGYMIPDSSINFAGIMLDTEKRLGDIAQSSTMADGGWGSDFTKVTIGPLFNWQINEKSSLIVLFQLQNDVEYTDDSVFYNYFMNRESTGESYWYFRRIALSYTVNL
ncbi:MAG: hypothetical protein PQJ60_01205 [Spirochaetales bacterium]|nr:hypothetical protein [Spirochaetales bacterium]